MFKQQEGGLNCNPPSLLQESLGPFGPEVFRECPSGCLWGPSSVPGVSGHLQPQQRHSLLLHLVAQIHFCSFTSECFTNVLFIHGFSCRSRRLVFTNSHIHLAITGECFTHSLLRSAFCRAFVVMNFHSVCHGFCHGFSRDFFQWISWGLPSLETKDRKSTEKSIAKFATKSPQNVAKNSLGKSTLQEEGPDHSMLLNTVLGTEKVSQRNCVTKSLPNVRVNFLVRFASKPLLYWVMTR